MQWSIRRAIDDAVFAWITLPVSILISAFLFAILSVNHFSEAVSISVPFGVMCIILAGAHALRYRLDLVAAQLPAGLASLWLKRLARLSFLMQNRPLRKPASGLAKSLYSVFPTSLWGILAGISVFFPLANALVKVIPLGTWAQRSGGLVYFSPQLVTVVATLMALFIILSTFTQRGQLRGQKRPLLLRQALYLFAFGLLTLIIYLVVNFFVVTGCYEHVLGWEDDNPLRLLGDVVLLLSYSFFFMLITRAFVLLGMRGFLERTHVASLKRVTMGKTRRLVRPEKEDIETFVRIIRDKQRIISDLRGQLTDPLTPPVQRANIEVMLKELEEESRDEVKALLQSLVVAFSTQALKLEDETKSEVEALFKSNLEILYTLDGAKVETVLKEMKESYEKSSD